MYSVTTQTPVQEVAQISELPLAIALPNALPRKGQKSFATKFYETRYRDADIFMNRMPNDCNFEVVILEGMFLINSSPLNTCRTFGDYAEYLIRRWVLHYFKIGFKQVQILFDDSNLEGSSPKAIERDRRDVEKDQDTLISK